MIKRDKNTSRRACFSPAQEKEIWAWNLEVSHYLRYLFPTTADDKGEFVMAENRHSYTAALPCGGTYTLVSGDRSRKFQSGSTFSMNVGGAE